MACFRQLLALPQVNLNAQGLHHGGTVLLVACKQTRRDLARELIQKGARGTGVLTLQLTRGWYFDAMLLLAQPGAHVMGAEIREEGLITWLAPLSVDDFADRDELLSLLLLASGATKDLVRVLRLQGVLPPSKAGSLLSDADRAAALVQCLSGVPGQRAPAPAALAALRMWEGKRW